MTKIGYWLIESPFTENGWRSGDIRPLIADREVVGGGYCSVCNTPALFTEYGTNTVYSQYCPKCGAFMKNWQSEELADAISEREAREADLYWQAKHQQEVVG